jgi:hypothetical protein
MNMFESDCAAHSDASRSHAPPRSSSCATGSCTSIVWGKTTRPPRRPNTCCTARRRGFVAGVANTRPNASHVIGSAVSQRRLPRVDVHGPCHSLSRCHQSSRAVLLRLRLRLRLLLLLRRRLSRCNCVRSLVVIGLGTRLVPLPALPTHVVSAKSRTSPTAPCRVCVVPHPCITPVARRSCTSPCRFFLSWWA